MIFETESNKIQTHGFMKRVPSCSARWANTNKLWTYMSSSSTIPKKPKSSSYLHLRLVILGIMLILSQSYCNQIYLADTSPPKGASTDADDFAPSIYNTLLSLYLNPPPPHAPQWPPALALLANHGARMPASSTLNLIPEILPVKDLEQYFRGRIRSGTTIFNESRVVAALRSSWAVEEEARLRLGEKGRNRWVKVTEERVCGVCHKRLGGSVIKVYADGRVVHYGCSRL